MNIRVLIAVVLMMLVQAPRALAQSEAEQTAKNLCAGCHGPEGISSNPLWPNLSGQQAPYLAKQLRDYRDGVRVEATMQAVTQILGEEQIEALAEYYAKLPLL